ncbi:MAG: sensory box histidine kinase PhoR [Acidimicrobiales bacterium]
MRGSVRVRLVVGLMVVVAIGLGAVDTATWAALRVFLAERVDAQLEATRRPIDAQIAGSSSLLQLAADPQLVRRVVPPGVFMQIRSPSGRVIATSGLTDGNATPVAPAIPVPLPKPEGVRAASAIQTVREDGRGTDRFRLEVFNARFGATVIVATSLRPVRDTVGRLVFVSLVASGIALIAVLVLVLLVVRLGLRPLDAMADTAAAIADGDLQRRVKGANGRTEAGRLGLALNAMLGQIEAAFANRRASEERLRRFVSDASHELRTPLTSIRGYAELFRSGAAERPDDLAKAMGRIESEATRMAGLLDDLLLLARLDQGRPLELTGVDLATLAADAVDDARVSAPGNPIAMEASRPVIVRGDAHQLRQVLANLVNNAVKHTPEGTPITVRSFTEGAVGVAEVADSGPGLTVEQTDRVWDRFWRAERTPAAGSGLGLSIVAAIAEAHGGRATVRSQPGAGATFRIEIPLDRSPEGRGAPAAPPTLAGSSTSTSIPAGSPTGASQA